MTPEFETRQVQRPAQMDSGFTIAPLNYQNQAHLAVISKAIAEKTLRKEHLKKDMKYTVGLFWDNDLVGFAIFRKDADKRWNLKVMYLNEANRDTDIRGEFLRRWFHDKTARVLVDVTDSKYIAELTSAGFYATESTLKSGSKTEVAMYKDTKEAYKFTPPADYRALLAPEHGGYTDEELADRQVPNEAFGTVE